jgi:hypothetical protein
MNEPKAFTIDGAGVREVEAPADLVEKAEKQAEDKRQAIAEQDAAEARLERARAQRGALIQPLIINGETWWIKLLDFTELSLAAILINRDKSGRVLMLNRKVLRSVIVAALHCGVAKSETNPEPYFSRQVAEEYAKEPAVKGLVAVLFNKITELNPELIPKKV